MKWIFCSLWIWACVFSVMISCAKKDGGGDTAATDGGSDAAGDDAVDDGSDNTADDGDDNNVDGDGDDSDGNPTVGSLALSENPLAVSYPEGMAVTALPEVVDPSPGTAAAGTLAIGLLLQSESEGDAPQHPKEKLNQAIERLNGTAEQCFSSSMLMDLTFQNTTGDVCFNPDLGIITGVGEGLLDTGRVNDVVNGITTTRDEATVLAALKEHDQFEADASGEACMVVKGREYVAANASKLDATLALLQGMLCQAKKDDLAKDIPAAGEELDLTAVFSGLDSGPNGATVTSAKLKRLADKDGRMVFRSEINLTLANANNSSGEWEFILTHSPSADGNSNYNGVLQVTSNRIENSIDRDVLTSMVYEKSGDTVANQRLQFEVRNAELVSDVAGAEPYFGDDGRLNINANDPDGTKGDSGSAGSVMASSGYFAADLNPSSYAGSISVWTNPGGGYTEPARGFVFETTQNDDGQLSGCAWAGAWDESIRKALKEGQPLLPTGCFTPKIDSDVCGVATNRGDQVWKQCFAQNADGVYLPDDSKNTDTTADYDVLQAAPDDMPELDSSGIPGL